MTEPGVAYIPADRYAALIENRPMPAREGGSVLFADITGFTPLTAAYAQTLGPRLGAEELTRQLNLVYDQLISNVTRFGGSVIGFSGDAITCWFGESWPPLATTSPAARAVACGEAMRLSSESFPVFTLPNGTSHSIGIKVSIASGSANRFLVGDPTIQVFDLLAGAPVERSAVGEHLIRKGEMVVDAATANALASIIDITEWRTAVETGEAFAMVGKLCAPVQTARWKEPEETTLDEELLRPWLLPQIYDHLQENGGDFPAELRPAVALFMRFVGIDFDDPTAGSQLDQFLRWVQSILQQYEGTLIQVTLGDKGSYLYAAFGAPIAHEDDARRAVAAALELRTLPGTMTSIQSIQIGISQGTMRVGAYGGHTRRTYGVLGDEVNVAARLMQHARSGEVIASKRVQSASSDEFSWELLPPLLLKGKQEPIDVARLQGRLAARQKKAFKTGLFGRDQQLRQLIDFLAPLWAQGFPGIAYIIGEAGMTMLRTSSLSRRSAGIAYIVGEAGMGKSRLLLELRSHLRTRLEVSWMICASDEIFRDSFQPFLSFLREYFSQSPEQSYEQNLTRFNDVFDGLLRGLDPLQLTELVGALGARRSHVAALLALHWEDSPYQRAEPQQRLQDTIEGLITLIQVESLRQPVILQVEDAHWLDADSIELLKQLMSRCVDYPIALLITCRHIDDGGLWAEGAKHAIKQEICNLHELSLEGIHGLACELLAAEVSSATSAFLREKTGGNPFFAEQMLLDLRERGLLVQTNGEWSLLPEALIEVPGTVNAVLIARLDRMAAKLRSAVQMASVLGQEFELRILSHMLPSGADVQELVSAADAASVWSSAREGRYHFRHALLRDAAYEMQLSVRKRELHQLAADAIKTVYTDELASQATELAYHYEQALDMANAALWHISAGENGMKLYALENVIFHYRKALACLDADPQRIHTEQVRRLKVLLELGNALRWRNRSLEARETLRDAYEASVALGDELTTIDASISLAAVQYDEGDFRLALTYATAAEQIVAHRPISRQLRTILEMKCWCLFRLGELEEARAAGERALQVSQQLDEPGQIAQSLSVLGLVLMASGQNQQAAQHFEHALSIASDPMDILGVTNNLGVIAVAIGDYQRAALRFEEALALARQHNIAEAEMVFRSNLGGARVGLGDFGLAEAELREVIRLTGDSSFGDLSETYRFLAESLLGQDRVDEALDAGRRALALGQEVSAPEFIAIAWRVLGQITSRRSAALSLGEADGNAARQYSSVECFANSLKILKETGMKGEIPRTLRVWALHELEHGTYDTGITLWQEALQSFRALGAEQEVDRMNLLPPLPSGSTNANQP